MMTWLNFNTVRKSLRRLYVVVRYIKKLDAVKYHLNAELLCPVSFIL